MKTDTTLSRRRLLASIPAAAATMTPAAAAALVGPPVGSTEPSGEDPIYAAIANWTQASAKHDAAWERVNNLPTPPEYKWRSHFETAETEEATARDFDTIAELLWTTPTTLRGFAALFEFLGSQLPYHASETAPYSGMHGAVEAFMGAYERDRTPPTDTEWAAMMAEGLRRLAQSQA
jgi:hypothetical protein